MFTFKVNDTIYDLPEDKVADFKATYPDAVEVTDEIQTEPKGKTSDVATVDAAVTSEPDTASESTELESVDTSGESENPDWLKEDIVADLNTVGDVREIDKRIKLLAGNNKDLKFVKEGEISLLDSPKRLFQYNKLINRKNDILKQTDKDIKNLATEEKIVESFDVDKPAIEGDSYITDEGGVYIASAPLVVDGEVVGSQAQPVSIGEVEVVGKRLSVDELSKKYNNFKDKAIADSFDVVATALELVPFESEFKTYVQEKSKENRSKRDLYNKLYQEGKIDLDATRSAFNTINNSMRTMVNLDDQFSYLDALIFSQSPDEETSKQGYSKLKKARENLNLKESYFLPTQRFDRLKEKSNAFEYVTGGLAGLFDAGMAVATTVAQTTPGLAVNILSSNLKEHNTIAAQRMGMTNEEYLKSGQADFVTPTVTTAFELGSEWLRLKQISNYINALPVGTQRQIAKTMTVMGGNGAQEIFQYGLNDFNKNDAAGMNFSQASMASIKAMLSPEAFEVGLKGAFGSGPIAVGGRLFNSNELKAQAAIKTTAEKGRIQSAINKLYELDQAKYSKNISTEQLKAINTAQYQIRKGLTSEVDANDKLVASLSEDQLEIINQNADLLTSIGAEIQATRDAGNLTDAQKESILEGLNEARKQASQQIYDVRNRAEADAATSKVQQVVSDLEAVNMQTLSTEEIQNYLQDNNLVENQDDAIKKSGEGAFIIQNTTTGEQEIIVNKDIGSISDAAHEGLHALMLQTVRKSPDTAIRLGESLRNELNKLDPNLIEDSGIRKRLELYNQDPTAVQMEEVLTLFSDTVTNGTVEFNDSTFTKIGDFIRQFLSKLGVKAKFNNGRDVYNFIKDYNKSIESGKLTRGQVRAAKEGVRGKLVGPKIETFDDAAIIKETRSEEASNRVQEIYDEQGEAGAFDIIEQFKPITSRIVERRSEAPGFDRQLLTDEIETGQRGIIDLIKEYKPESGVPLAAYINKFLPARAIEASKRVLGEEFTEDVTEARDVAAEEVVTETAVKPEAKAIDPFRIMPNVKEAAVTEVQESIADKDVDVTEVTYKELKDVAPYQTVADFFNIPVSRIKNPKDNLRKSDDVANIQRWILKNEPTLKNLFTEANRDVIEVTEGNRVIRQGGEPTAIPRNLLNKFYTKGDRVGNNFQWKLKPYDRTTFLEAVGIRDGKVDPDFTPRAAEAQTIKGILDMYTRNLGNVAARDIIEGREDIAPAERARAKAEVAKGKPRIMMAKALPKAEQNQIAKDNNITNEELSELLKKPLDQLAEENIDVFNDVNQYMLEDTQAPVDFKNEGFLTMVSKASPELEPFIKRKGHLTRRTVDGEYVFDEAAMQDHVDNYSMQLLDFIPAYMGKREANAKVNYKFLNNAILKGSSSRGNAGGSLEIRKANQQKFNEKVGQMKPLNETKASPETKKAWREFEKVQNNLELAESTFTGPETLLRKIQEIQAMDITAKQKVKEAQKIFNAKSLDAAQKLFKAYNLSVQDWVNNQVESGNMTREVAMEYVVRDKQKNTNFNKGERALAAFTSVYFTDGPQTIEKTKGEHVKDSATVSALTTTSIYNNTFGQDALEILNGFEQSYVPKRFADEMDALGGANSQLKNKRFLFNPDIGNQVFDLSTGKTMYELELENATQKIVQDLGRLQRSQIKASRSNNNQLMPVVKFAKQVPNSEVLNRMGELDADAKQANKEFYDSVDLNKEFNDILEVKTGIASEKRYKRVKAEVVGANKGRFQFFIPPSAEDFTGLLYSTLAKGKLGDAQMAWYKKNLLDPYGKAMNELSSARIAMMNDYKQLKKELEIVPKDLRKKVPGEPFTREQAVRVYIWQKQGMSVPGISETDMKDLSDYVAKDTELQLFAEQLINIQKGDQYAGPKEGWPAGTITTDMLEGLNTIKRAKALEQWQANANEIFSEENLNKLEAAYGKPYRKAMENMLQRMKSGRNRNFQGDTLTGRFTDWVTGSIGTIMFFNTRSALLQTISSINFVNFTDNNILAAGKAFANQEQYWSDFMTLMNSDFLKERRGGLRINVSEADIADMAKKGGAKGVINKLLEFGFTPTQIADSFAIASGGATFYRNRIKSLKKQGMTDAEAEAQAFVDFRETAEESQQSSRPDRISMQQAGPLGRLVLAFANTPAQYARLIKKAASDLKNGRGDAKTNISKIIYYGVAQNLLFNALQQALFAFAFDDDEEDTEEQQKKYVGIANGMMDSLLRGMGLGGAVVSVGKNAIIRIINEMEKKQPKLEKVGYEITKLSPPISAKLSRINQAARSYQWDKKDMMEKGWSLDNPAYLASANVIAALTNIPLDRAVKKTNNVVQATSQDLETWERLALLGGWQDWEIGVDKETETNKPQPRKVKKKKVKKKKKKIKR